MTREVRNDFTTGQEFTITTLFLIKHQFVLRIGTPLRLSMSEEFNMAEWRHRTRLTITVCQLSERNPAVGEFRVMFVIVCGLTWTSCRTQTYVLSFQRPAVKVGLRSVAFIRRNTCEEAGAPESKRGVRRIRLNHGDTADSPVA